MTFKPCIVCGGHVEQIREAFFSCIDCGQEFISTAEVMRGVE